MSPTRKAFPQDQRGQIFSGYIVAVFIISALIVTITLRSIQSRKSSQDRIYKDIALNVAKSGLTEAVSYYQKQLEGVYANQNPALNTSAIGMECCPQTQSYTAATTAAPWAAWPDYAFLPQSYTTDNYNLIKFAPNLCVNCTGFSGKPIEAAMGIMRTYPAHNYVTYTGAAEKSTGIWARYVLRRQNARNWSPGANTYAAFTDPEALHDLTGLRGSGSRGGGLYWSIVSHGYIFKYPADLTITTAHENGDLLAAPLGKFLGKPLLLAEAKVYGEIYKLTVNTPNPAAALGVPNTATVTVATKGRITTSASGTYAITASSGPVLSNSGIVTGGTFTVADFSPTIAAVFPGMTKALLWDKAYEVGFRGTDINIFPNRRAEDYFTRITRTTFYYLRPSSGTATFISGGDYVMSGTGLVYIEGNLVIQERSFSSWNGIVFVDGNVTLRGPADISGMLIASGNVINIGQTGDLNDTNVTYNQSTVETAQKYVQDFTLLKSSVVATQ